jgi:ABC-type Zn uptake system ZnuABC Zn-binding protein ZnuA
LKKVLIPILSAFLILTCEHSMKEAERLPDVMTSIYPLYDLIRNVAGDEIKVDYIMPVGANPHHYEVTPADVKRIQSARYFIGVHPEFDGWLKSLVHPKAQIMYLAGVVNHEGQPHHSHEEENPHIWLYPVDTKRLVEQIAHYLSDYFPEQKDQIQERSLSYNEKLDSLDLVIRPLFTGIDNPRFVQWHPAWDDFAQAYGLEIAGTISHGHGDRPSVKEFKNLTDLCKKKDVRVVVVGLNAEGDLAETLVKEIDGKLVRLDTIGDPSDPVRDTYIELMYYNAKVLAEAMK